MAKQSLSWGDIPMEKESTYKSGVSNDDWLYLGGSAEGNAYRIRLLGNPCPFVAHYSKVTDGSRDKNNRITYKHSPFPDADRFTRKKRICSEDDSCVWCKLGYQKSQRFLANVIDRSDGRVKIVELPLTIARGIRKWYEMNKEDFPKGPGAMDDEVFDFEISVKTNQRGIPEYSCVTVGREAKLLSEEERDEIKKLKSKENGVFDLHVYCEPSYLSHEIQMNLFGEVIQENPYERNRDDDEYEDEDGEQEEYDDTDEDDNYEDDEDDDNYEDEDDEDDDDYEDDEEDDDEDDYEDMFKQIADSDDEEEDEEEEEKPRKKKRTRKKKSSTSVPW